MDINPEQREVDECFKLCLTYSGNSAILKFGMDGDNKG